MATTWTIPVSNPSWETGDTTNWVHRVGSALVSTPGLLLLAAPAGNYYAYGGTNVLFDTYQVFSIETYSGLSIAVDSGLAEMVWRCQQGALQPGDGDPGGIYLNFLDASLVRVGYHSTDMKQANSVFVANILPSLIPPTTRVVQAGFYGYRASGASNHAFFDVFSLVAQTPWDSVKQKHNLTVLNPEAVDGNSFWTVFTGNFISENRNFFNATTPSFFASSANVTTPVVSQNIDLWAVVNTQMISSGGVYAVMKYQWAVQRDSGRLAWKFYAPDSSTLLGSSNIEPCGPYVPGGVSSLRLGHQTLVPSGTRYAQIEMLAINRGGAQTNFYFDSVSAYLMVDSGYIIAASGGAVKRAFPNESAFRLFPLVLNRAEPVV
jgi:hypothetical protein